MEEKKDDWNKHRNWWTRGTEPEEDGPGYICSIDRVTCNGLVGSSSLL